MTPPSTELRIARENQRIVEYIARGMTIERVALAMRLTERTIYVRLAKYPELRERAATMMGDLNPDATAVLIELLSSADERIRLQAAIGLLRNQPEAEAAAETTMTLIVRRDGTAEITDTEPEQDEGPLPEPPPYIFRDPVPAAAG